MIVVTVPNHWQFSSIHWTLILWCFDRHEFPGQSDLFSIDDSFLLGSAILVAPVLSEGATERNITLPANEYWYESSTGKLVSGSWGSTHLRLPVTLDTVPAFLRGGSIIPIRERTRRSTAAAAKVSEFSSIYNSSFYLFAFICSNGEVWNKQKMNIFTFGFCADG